MKFTVTVFCGSSVNQNHKDYYYNLARKAGEHLACLGLRIVCGGGTGLMDEILRSAQNKNGETLGICLDRSDIALSQYLSSCLYFKKLSSRQNKLITIGDAYLALPGGIGTLYEIAEIIERKKIGEIDLHKPLIVVDDYFFSFKTMLQKAHFIGFLPENIDSLVRFESEIEKAVNYLDNFFKNKSK